MKKVQYTTVAPVTSRGKWTVCSRRVGPGERYYPIATCATESHAEQIVAALNGMDARVLHLQAAE